MTRLSAMIRTALLLLALGCGGKTTSNVDAGVDAPACKDNGACSSDDQCCLGPCDKDAGLCLGDCVPDLASCNLDSDCCSVLCAGNGLCGCIELGKTGCTIDSDCCSATYVCVGGVCQP